MHVVTDRIDAVYGNIMWEHTVQAVCELLAVKWLRIVEMRYHGFGMDTCVCTSGTNHRHLCAQYHGKAALQLALDRYAVGLYLPSMVTFTIKTQLYEISGHIINV